MRNVRTIGCSLKNKMRRGWRSDAVLVFVSSRRSVYYKRLAWEPIPHIWDTKHAGAHHHPRAVNLKRNRGLKRGWSREPHIVHIYSTHIAHYVPPASEGNKWVCGSGRNNLIARLDRSIAFACSSYIFVRIFFLLLFLYGIFHAVLL